MASIQNILVVLAAFVIAYCSTPLAIKAAFKLDAIDKPDQRKVHHRTLPRLGGLAILRAL